MKGEMLQQNVPWRRVVRPRRNRGAVVGWRAGGGGVGLTTFGNWVNLPHRGIFGVIYLIA
jgi:hypothetical protein